MEGLTELEGLSCLDIVGDDGITCGASQKWYKTGAKKTSGCGPTTASMMLWYLSRTRPGFKRLCPYDCSTRAGFTTLMDEVFGHMPPGLGGVSNTARFSRGMISYAREHGFELLPRTLDIPSITQRRPREERLFSLISDVLERGNPVAFLNHSNGSLKNLDAWHWVLIVGVNRQSGEAVIYDAGKRSVIALGQWLRTSLLGGGFVSL